jgi:hypothetical protein
MAAALRRKSAEGASLCRVPCPVFSGARRTFVFFSFFVFALFFVFVSSSWSSCAAAASASGLFRFFAPPSSRSQCTKSD